MLKLENKIKLVATDLDGVLTNGKLYLNEKLEQSKRFDFQDLMGMWLLKEKEVVVSIITGEKPPFYEYFRQNIGLEEIHVTVWNKKKVLWDLIKKYNLEEDEVLYIGDDINDIEILQSLKNCFSVPSANKKVKEVKNIQITEHQAGDGAFREIADAVIEFY